jgi:hypothetical protein
MDMDKMVSGPGGSTVDYVQFGDQNNPAVTVECKNGSLQFYESLVYCQPLQYDTKKK